MISHPPSLKKIEEIPTQRVVAETLCKMCGCWQSEQFRLVCISWFWVFTLFYLLLLLLIFQFGDLFVFCLSFLLFALWVQSRMMLPAILDQLWRELPIAIMDPVRPPFASLVERMATSTHPPWRVRASFPTKASRLACLYLALILPKYASAPLNAQTMAKIFLCKLL